MIINSSISFFFVFKLSTGSPPCNLRLILQLPFWHLRWLIRERQLGIDDVIESVIMIVCPPAGTQWRWSVFVGAAGNVGCALAVQPHPLRQSVRPSITFWPNRRKKGKYQKHQPTTNENKIRRRIQNNPWLCGAGNQIFGPHHNNNNNVNNINATTKKIKKWNEIFRFRFSVSTTSTIPSNYFISHADIVVI